MTTSERLMYAKGLRAGRTEVLLELYKEMPDDCLDFYHDACGCLSDVWTLVNGKITRSKSVEEKEEH